MSRGWMIAQRLQSGETIKRNKEGGNSMLPLIRSRQPVDLSPVTDETELKVDDIVYCKVKGNYYTHKIAAIRGEQYQIANNKGFVNGWISRSKIYGIVTKIWSE